MLKINLGSGYRPRENCTNIDIRPECEPDMIIDICNGLPFGDGTIDVVYAYDFLEHIPRRKTVFVVEEIWRVLRHRGLFEHFTPSTDGRGAFQDPTHLSYWNFNSWFYYIDETHRELLGTKAKFSPEKLVNHVTDQSNQIIHVFGRFYAIKE